MLDRHFLSLLLVLWACAVPLRAQEVLPLAAAPAPPAPYAAAIAESRALIDALVERERIPGLAAAVLVDGRIVWSEGFGYADLENRVPVTPLTKMRIGSVSKPLTSVALGKLVEEGKLDLDAPVQRYVPSFPEKRYPITTRQAAGHLAGIRHYRGDEFLSHVRYASVLDGLTIFADDSLLFEPGTDYAYSSYGWNLVSAVVEGAAGVPFLRYMREAVFEPMGLRHTVAGHTDSLIAYRTRFYARSGDGRILNAPYVDNSHKWAGGGFLSTAEDLVRFGDALLRGTALRPETVALLFASLETADGRKTNYGLGWRTGTDAEGRRTVGHSGGSIGGTTRFVIYPDDRVVVALICNLGSVDYDAAEERIAHFFITTAD